MPQILKFNSTTDFIYTAVDFIQDKIQNSSNEYDLFRLALSGGGTPLPVYHELFNHESIDWNWVDIFQLDERYVPNQKGESNQFKIQEVAGKNLQLMHEVNWFDLSQDYETAAENYNLLLESLDNEEFLFDLSVLGMGIDAHVASLFPNSELLLEKEKLAGKNLVENKFPKRLSLTYPAIEQSKQAILLIQGTEKLETLQKALDENSTFLDFPIRRLIDNLPQLNIFIDLSDDI
jgi:6-phosphogluconolactonase